MKLHIIDTGFFKLDGGAMFGVVPKSIWHRQYPADENNMVTWAMRCLLVEVDDRRILIDTGIGDKQSEEFFKHYYLQGEDTLLGSIAKAGFTSTDITDVFLTHLHFDHVGGASIKQKDGSIAPTFPNAVYWSNLRHWDWAMNPNPREKASFLKENLEPLMDSGQLSFINPLQESPFPSIEIWYVDGHTEQQMLPIINYNGQKIAYCADLIPSAGHIKIPYVMAFDVKPLNTMEEKSQFLEKAFKENWVLFFEHDAYLEAATLKEKEGRILKNTSGELGQFISL